MSEIRAIEIDGLNGKTNLRIQLKGKHCIIVGPNGSGKSTALQIVALAMGRQWSQLTKMRFSRLALHFDKGMYSLSREACGSSFGSPNAPIKFSRFFQRLTELNLFEEFTSSDLNDQSQLDRFGHIAQLTRMDVRNAQRVARTRFLDREGYSEVNDFQKGLNSLGIPKTVYLPTYRRIELELARLTNRFPEYMQRDFAETINTKFDTEFYEEIVRFGMDDVVSSLKAFETKTRDFSRNRFNKMMSSYLKEMANSQSISINDLRSFDIDEDRIQTVLSRIEEGILSESEKAEISNIVLSMAKPQKGGGHPPFHKRWLSHFFVRLLEVDSDIQQLEKPVTELVAILKKYVAPKNVSYDIESYHFSVTDIYGDEIALSDLSSGEKQLLSLIALLQLSRRQKANVFIDEPELSLSVPWQYEFLPDISITGACNQIFAVTHSPFIYDNILADSVVDFLACSSPQA